jgi:hypothetical protein
MTSFFETREFGAYGAIAEQTGGDYTAINFKKGEKKTFSITLPKGNLAKFYNVKVQLMSGDSISNPISVYYILRGVNASVYQLSLDKDYYRAGEKGEVSFVWSGPSSKYIRGGSVTGPQQSVNLNLAITNDKGAECITPIKRILTKNVNTPQEKIPFSVESNCTDPNVSATLTDNTGKVLDQKDFNFKTISTVNVTTHKTNYWVWIIVMIILIGFAVYLKKKNKAVNKV